MQARLDSPLPQALSIGAGTALFVCGTCFDEDGEIDSLNFVVDGVEQPVTAHGMPRLDHLQALGQGYASGFWGLVRIGPREIGATVVIGLRARLAGGADRTVELARLNVSAPPEPVSITAPDPEAGPLVAICMATYDPPPDLFRRQIDSIRAQTYPNWVCLISDDCSRPDRFAQLEAVVAGDPRFVVSRSSRRLGFYLNFERALGMAPPDVDYVALSDQDDAWYPDKLATLLRTIGDKPLVYSDARIIGRGGEVLAETYWSRRENNHDDLLSLLLANAVTGGASLLRRGLLDDALPFPPAQFAHYHDHWLGLVALVTGGIEYVDRPLYDYVQHGQAALGHAAANRITRLRDRAQTLRNDPRERVRVSRTRYFVDVQRLNAFAAILQLRCGDRLSPHHRATLERFAALEDSPAALAALGARAVRELARRRPQTLGAEWALFQAYSWRRLLAVTAGERSDRRLRLDALPPPDLAPRAGRARPGAPGPRAMADKIAPLELAVSDEAPRRVNLLIPTIDLEHFFGGYIGKFNLARRLAAHGHRVRLVTVDPVGPLPRSWRSTIESYSGLAGVFDEVELTFGRGAGGLEVSRADAFIATTWWTAHIARRALEVLGGERFLYLVQEYEPFTFPMGSWAALAAESYTFPHHALFSTELLRGYFRNHGIGVYAGGAAAGDAASASFENAITPIAPPTLEELRRRSTRRLLFYARPETHAQRNLFELGVLALGQVLDEGVFRGGWELHGIGTVGAGRRLELGADAALELLPRSRQGAYAERLPGYDVGLALMYTPHPSLVPIEMASAGLLTVTSTFENKTSEALRTISSNLIAGEPTIAGIAAALREAAAGADDAERRLRGAEVAWSRDWSVSFDDALLGHLSQFLAPPA